MSEALLHRPPGDRRTFFTAAAADYALHMLIGAVMFRARELGAEPGTLGLVGAAGDVVYTVGCLTLGGLSERTGRRSAVRGAVVAFMAAGLIAYTATSLWSLVLALVVQRIAASIFWPTIQGRLADQSSNLGRDAGLFNLSWSVGKSLGYFTNFLLFGPLALPTSSAFAVSGAAALMIGLFMPPDRRIKAVREDGCRVDPADSATASRRIGVALLGNFAGCTAFTVLTNQSPVLMASRGYGSDFGSLLIACFTTAQIAAFVFAFRRHDVVGRVKTLLLATVFILFGAVWFALSRGKGSLICAAAMTGFGAGLAYAQAMLLSLRLPAAAVKGAGRHEAVIGAANATTAPFAGMIAGTTGKPDDAVWAAAGVVACIGLVQTAKLVAGRGLPGRSAAEPRNPDGA